MKRPALLIACLLAAVLLCACGPEAPPASPDPPDEPEPAVEEVFITFRNEVETADVWLLPQTEENLHTSLWGTATLPQLSTGAEQRVSLTALGGPGVYLMRAIDVDEMFYDAGDISLEAGYVLRLCESEDPGAATLEVTDITGAQVAVYSVFAARL